MKIFNEVIYLKSLGSWRFLENVFMNWPFCIQCTKFVFLIIGNWRGFYLQSVNFVGLSNYFSVKEFLFNEDSRWRVCIFNLARKVTWAIYPVLLSLLLYRFPYLRQQLHISVYYFQCNRRFKLNWVFICSVSSTALNRNISIRKFH